MKKPRAKKTSPRQSQASPPPVPKRPRHWLMPNELYEFIDKCKAGKLPLDEPVIAARHPVVRDVLPLIEADGDFGVLCDMVKANPRLMTHPVVSGIIEHLQGVPLRCSSYHTAREEAEGMLHQISTAWVQGILPGYSVKPPKRRGRKVAPMELDERSDLLDEYERVLQSLRGAELSDLDGESTESSKRRWIRVVRRIWKESGLSEYVYLARSVPSDINSPRVYRTREIPLSDTEIKPWVDTAMSRRQVHETMLDYLAYCLVGHRYRRTANQVKYAIQQERAPTSKRKRPRRNRLQSAAARR